jgi:hypothetical protein
MGKRKHAERVDTQKKGRAQLIKGTKKQTGSSARGERRRR